MLEARLVLGLVKQVLGDDAGARSAYDAVIAAGPGNPFASAGRLNRAKLDIDSGAVDRAWSEYDALLAADPRDVPARLSPGTARPPTLAARRRPMPISRSCFSRPPSGPTRFSRPAPGLGWCSVRSKEPNPTPRAPSAASPSPSRERLWIRTLLALHRVDDLLWLNRPDDLTILPGGGPALNGRSSRGPQAT